MATFKKRSGGAWVDITAPKRRAAGAWVALTTAKVREGGVWVNILPTGGGSAAVSPEFVVSSGSTSRTAGIQFTNTGVQNSRVQSTYTNEGTWLLSGVAADYDIMATLSSGSIPTTGSIGTWENLGATREWTVVDPTADMTAVEAVLFIEIRPAGGGATLASGTITIQADRV